MKRWDRTRPLQRFMRRDRERAEPGNVMVAVPFEMVQARWVTTTRVLCLCLWQRYLLVATTTIARFDFSMLHI